MASPLEAAASLNRPHAARSSLDVHDGGDEDHPGSTVRKHDALCQLVNPATPATNQNYTI